MNADGARYRFRTRDFLRGEQCWSNDHRHSALVVEASINLADDEELEKADQNLRCLSALQCPGHYSRANSLLD